VGELAMPSEEPQENITAEEPQKKIPDKIVDAVKALKGYSQTREGVNLVWTLGIIEDTFPLDDDTGLSALDQLAPEDQTKLEELGITQETEVNGRLVRKLTKLGEKVINICWDETPSSIRKIERNKREEARQARENFIRKTGLWDS
jgi:hypothetical protein